MSRQSDRYQQSGSATYLRRPGSWRPPELARRLGGQAPIPAWAPTEPQIFVRFSVVYGGNRLPASLCFTISLGLHDQLISSNLVRHPIR